MHCLGNMFSFGACTAPCAAWRLPLEGKYPKPPAQNPGRGQSLGGYPCRSFSFVSSISFHFGLLGLHFLSFWPFGASFPFILAFWAFISFYISFHFGLLNLPKRPSGQDFAQNCNFPFRFCNFSFSKICLLRPYFLSFWPFGPSFPFILAFGGFISFHFGLVGLHFLSFWPPGRSFPFILAF